VTRTCFTVLIGPLDLTGRSYSIGFGFDTPTCQNGQTPAVFGLALNMQIIQVSGNHEYLKYIEQNKKTRTDLFPVKFSRYNRVLSLPPLFA